MLYRPPNSKFEPAFLPLAQTKTSSCTLCALGSQLVDARTGCTYQFLDKSTNDDSSELQFGGVDKLTLLWKNYHNRTILYNADMCTRIVYAINTLAVSIIVLSTGCQRPNCQRVNSEIGIIPFVYLRLSLLQATISPVDDYAHLRGRSEVQQHP